MAVAPDSSCPTFLCLRRGVSVVKYLMRAPYNFSLPTQRCFHCSFLIRGEDWLFSAYAEVFPL